MLDDPEDVFAACLKKLGLRANSRDTAELRRAQHEAIVQKPLLRAYLNAEVRDQLVAGDVLAAQLGRLPRNRLLTHRLRSISSILAKGSRCIWTTR